MCPICVSGIFQLRRKIPLLFSSLQWARRFGPAATGRDSCEPGSISDSDYVSSEIAFAQSLKSNGINAAVIRRSDRNSLVNLEKFLHHNAFDSTLHSSSGRNCQSEQ
jgi:hypothetical protein